MPHGARFRHVAAATEPERPHPALRAAGGLVIRPFVLPQVAVGVEVDQPDPAFRERIGDLLGRKPAIAVLVVLRAQIGERGNLALVAVLELRAARPVNEDEAVLNDGRGLHLERQPLHPPHFVPGRQRIGGQIERPWHEQLRRRIRRTINDGRRVAGLRFRSFDPPALTSRLLVKRDHERPGALVAHEHHHPVRNDRRRPHAVRVVERTERHAPALSTLTVVRDQAEILEKDVHVPTVGRRRRRCRMIPLVHMKHVPPWHLAAPDDATGGAIQRDRKQPFALERGHEEPIS